MSADDIRQQYKDACLQPVTVRRFVGDPPVKTDYMAPNGNQRLYGTKEIKDGIAQGDIRVVVMVEGWQPAGFQLPITVNDKIVYQGRARQIITFGERCALDGTLIAYEIQARG